MQHDVDAATADMSSYFAQRLNDGRRHLSAERPAAALTAFRQASYHPDFAGDAYNGMAIAYDRMGRYDLAERFFAQAMEAAPEDHRFARNAARFETSMLARRATSSPVELASVDTDSTETELAEVLPQIAEALDAEVGPAPAERMQRVSSREVSIASRDDWTTRLESNAAARPAVLHIGDTALAQLGPHLEEPQYPVRISLASVPVSRAASPAQVAPQAPGSRFAEDDGSVRVRVSGTLIPPQRAAYPVTLTFDPPG